MKKIFLILALSFAFLPLFAGEKFLAKYYKVKTTNNPPYTYEFCTIQKGSIVLYLDTKTKNLLKATPRITTSDGKNTVLRKELLRGAGLYRKLIHAISKQ